MTRELDVSYKKMCWSCKRQLLLDNKVLLKRLLERHSNREVELMTGIPKSTLARFQSEDSIDHRMSESLCKRTLGNESTGIENGDNLGVDVTELSKRLKEVGQNGG